MDLQTFNSLVSRMLSTNNTDRTAAEKQYEEIERKLKIQNLFALYMTSEAAIEVRSLCLVLLRRLLSSEWDELTAALGTDFKQLTDQVLKCAVDETDTTLRKKLADVLAELARNTIDEDTGKQNWQDVLKFLEHCMQTDRPELKLTAMTLIEGVPNIFGSDQDNYMRGIKQLLESCLTHSSSPVRAAAAKAFVAFVTMNEDDDKLIKGFSGSIPAVIEICKHVVETEEDDDSPIQALSDLASCVPKIITPHLDAIFNMCIAVIANTEKDNTYRHSAMEVLTAICECAPNTVKKRGASYIPGILQSAILLMTELDDDMEEWLAVDDIEEGDLDEPSPEIGESSLDRIACSLNGKVLLHPFQSIAQQLLADENWTKRHAALMGLSTIGEGCRRAMEPVIVNVVDTIVPFLTDPHPRVRYAACNALGQMSTDFAPTLQKKCHAKVVGGLLTALEDISCPRVSAHAGAALVNFSEDCPQSVIAAYLQPLMAKLEQVVEATFKMLQEKGKKIILEQVITTIASVADAAQKVFADYYDRLMPPLKYILEHTDDPRFKTLRGKTIECISLIGLAVGKEKFSSDAVDIMRIVSTCLKDLSYDDPQTNYMISGMGRISKVLGPDFAPFLPMAMDLILRTASYTPQVTVLDDDEVNEEDPAWEFHNLGDNKNFGIRTSGLEEKATACELIVCFARDLKEAFGPYVDQIAQMMITHIKFLFHDGVRSAAAETMPCLLDCVKNQGIEAMRRLWVVFFPALQTASEDDNDLDTLSNVLSSISECVESLGPQGISPEEITKIGEILKTQIDNYETRRNEREAEEADEDEDPDEAKEHLDEQMQEEAAVLSNISDIIHSCFKSLGANFYPVAEPLLPKIMTLVDGRRHYTDRQWGICMLDDFIEFAPSNIAPHQSQFVPQMLNCLGDEYPEVRQAAAYGFGIMAMNGGAEYVHTCTGALEPLAAMISKPEARSSEEGSIATENAIAAVAKILKHAGSQVDITQVIPTFISWLPTYEDQQESPHIYGYFCDLVESSHPAVLGSDNSNLPRVLDIVVSSFSMSAFEEGKPEADQVKARLVNIIKSLQQGGLLEKVAQAANLDVEKQAILQHLLA